MLGKVISGGQTGADQAGWRAAKAFGIPTGGFMTFDFMTEDGPRPDFATTFGAVAILQPDYVLRTRLNVEHADATLWFGSTSSNGYGATRRACGDFMCCFLVVESGKGITPKDVVEWLREMRVDGVVNVAGNRESKCPGIGARVERFLCDVFARIGHVRSLAIGGLS